MGAIEAFTISSSMGLVARTHLLRQIKDSGSYKQVSPTWEAFCKEQLPWARRTVDEDIRFLDRLGEEFMLAADSLQLGRRQLRALSAMPTDLLPRAEENEIVIGEERVALADKDAVLELIDGLVTQQERMKARLDAGERQLQERDDRVGELETELRAIEAAREGQVSSPFAITMIRAIRLLRKAADLLSHDDAKQRPDPTEVLTFVRASQPTMSELVHYGGQYVAPEWMTDADALRDHMLAREEAAEAEPAAADGPELVDEEVDPLEGIPEVETWDDEDTLL